MAKKRNITDAGREAIASAQRKRWAAHRARKAGKPIQRSIVAVAAERREQRPALAGLPIDSIIIIRMRPQA